MLGCGRRATKAGASGRWGSKLGFGRRATAACIVGRLGGKLDSTYTNSHCGEQLQAAGGEGLWGWAKSDYGRWGA